MHWETALSILLDVLAFTSPHLHHDSHLHHDGK